MKDFSDLSHEREDIVDDFFFSLLTPSVSDTRLRATETMDAPPHPIEEYIPEESQDRLEEFFEDAFARHAVAVTKLPHSVATFTAVVPNLTQDGGDATGAASHRIPLTVLRLVYTEPNAVLSVAERRMMLWRRDQQDGLLVSTLARHVKILTASPSRDEREVLVARWNVAAVLTNVFEQWFVARRGAADLHQLLWRDVEPTRLFKETLRLFGTLHRKAPRRAEGVLVCLPWFHEEVERDALNRMHPTDGFVLALQQFVALLRDATAATAGERGKERRRAAYDAMDDAPAVPSYGKRARTV